MYLFSADSITARSTSFDTYSDPSLVKYTKLGIDPCVKLKIFLTIVLLSLADRVANKWSSVAFKSVQGNILLLLKNSM